MAMLRAVESSQLLRNREVWPLAGIGQVGGKCGADERAEQEQACLHVYPPFRLCDYGAAGDGMQGEIAAIAKRLSTITSQILGRS